MLEEANCPAVMARIEAGAYADIASDPERVADVQRVFNGENAGAEATIARRGIAVIRWYIRRPTLRAGLTSIGPVYSVGCGNFSYVSPRQRGSDNGAACVTCNAP